MVEGLSGEDRDRVMMIEGRVLKPEDRIHDLVDIFDDVPELQSQAPSRRDRPEIIYDLTDVVERKPKMALVDTGLHDEIMKRAQEIAEKIAEKIAREVVPAVAERVIREEIEKLKKGG